MTEDAPHPAMKPVAVSLFLITLALAACSTGCKKEGPVDATPALAQSFQAAEPEAKQVIERVNASLKVGNITEATRTLEPLVVSRKLTEPQKEAIGIALRQINQAIAAKPALDTKEMYDLRARMFQAVHSGPGF
jgi:hypothetical protein